MNGMHVPERYENNVGLLTVCTRAVALTLSPEEIHQAYVDLRRKMRKQDPQNPDLWSTEVRGEKLWGILDRRAGPQGEDVFTILFPSDY